MLQVLKILVIPVGQSKLHTMTPIVTASATAAVTVEAGGGSAATASTSATATAAAPTSKPTMHR
ncbi:MAG: hypothetical protein EXR68_04250 [Dehalococcoidia bacterium]|nr:hypothetical protein [Dehalococcoidia bacterium]